MKLIIVGKPSVEIPSNFDQVKEYLLQQLNNLEVEELAELLKYAYSRKTDQLMDNNYSYPLSESTPSDRALSRMLRIT